MGCERFAVPRPAARSNVDACGARGGVIAANVDERSRSLQPRDEAPRQPPRGASLPGEASEEVSRNHPTPSAACAAANRATGTRNGEQLT